MITQRWDILAVIAAGGAVGSVARWGLAQLIPHRAGEFPLATLDTNVLGCLLLGILMVFVLDVWPPSRFVRPFLGVGVLGGFTTFSTAMLDVRELLVEGRAAVAGAYLIGSLFGGLIGVWAGVLFARLIVRWARARRMAALRRRARARQKARRTARTPLAVDSPPTQPSTTRSTP